MVVPTEAIEPESDADGFYFVCPSCEGRNRLINASEDDDENGGGLTQPDV